MPLAEYLASEQAREDVKALIERRRLTPNFADIHAKNPHRFMGITKTRAWHVVTMSVEGETCQALYRPDGDRYIVTDLGEGVRALRLKGVGLREIKPRVDAVMTAMWQGQTEFVAHFPAALIEGEIGTVNHPKADQLPDAICRVMLASQRVAQS